MGADVFGLQNNMIIVRLKGGLGNQLFQYAFGRLLTLQNKRDVKYIFSEDKDDIKRGYKLGHFNTYVTLATDREYRAVKYPFGYLSKIVLFTRKVFRQFNIGYNPQSLKTQDGYLEGFWQSYKYLEPIRKDLLKEITLKEPLREEWSSILHTIETTNSVSVHIRRGDYVNNPKNRAEYTTFGIEYYNQAFQTIHSHVPEPTLIVFSDDIAWCKEHIKTDFPILFTDQNAPDYEAFMLATRCKHNILSNSTFAFWIAWLNQNSNKIVIAPKKWNNRYEEEYKDLLPENWIKI